MRRSLRYWILAALVGVLASLARPAAGVQVVDLVGLPQLARLGYPVTWVASVQGGGGEADLVIAVPGVYGGVSVSALPSSTTCTPDPDPALLIRCQVIEWPTSVTVRATPVVTRRLITGTATLVTISGTSVDTDEQFMRGVYEYALPIVAN